MKHYLTNAGLISLILLISAVISCTAQERDNRPPSPAMPLKEASTAFDLEHVGPFLDRVSSMVDSGFGAKERESLSQMVSEMKVDEERTREFTIQYHGHPTLLRIHVFMDDIKSPDVYFFTTPELADQIQREMVEFLDARGL
jgi:hypothetical protein